MHIRKSIYFITSIFIFFFITVITAQRTNAGQISLMPERNFVYVMLGDTDKTPSCLLEVNSLLLKGSQTVISSPDSKTNGPPCPSSHFYLYDFKTETSQKITLDQAKSLVQIGEGQTDGYTITQSCQNPSSAGICLQKNADEKRLNIQSSKEDNFIFLGWTEKNPKQ